MKTTRNKRAFAKRRGSALIFVAVMSVAITTVVIGTVQVNLVAAKKAEQRITEAKAEQTFEAQIALVKAISKDQSITLPYSSASSINGIALTCNVVDNSGSVLRTVRITSSGTSGGKTYSFDRVIGGRQTSHPFYYALWSEDNLDTTSDALTTSVDGHVYVHGDATLGATTIIRGDVQVTGSVDVGAAAVYKNAMGSVYQTDRPLIFMANFQSEASSVSAINTLGSLTIPGLLVNGHYQIRYYTDANKISGVFGGKGTLVFEQNLRVTDDVTYLNGAARTVFICWGDLDIDNSVTQLNGMWYVRGDVTTNNNSTVLNIPRGSLLIGGRNRIRRPLNITYDNMFWTGRTEALKHCVPGFWPSAATGILR